MVDEEKSKVTQDLTGDGLGDLPLETPDPETRQQGGAQSGGDEGELARLRAELLDLTSRLMRAQADFENYRKRVAREREELALYANQKLLLGILPVLDNLERALAVPPAPGDEKLRQGVELTARSFREILAREGLEPIEAVGQAFDPNRHEAVTTIESEEHEDGTVVMEFQKGYRLGDRVIRPSMVQVSKKG